MKTPSNTIKKIFNTTNNRDCKQQSKKSKQNNKTKQNTSSQKGEGVVQIEMQPYMTRGHKSGSGKGPRPTRRGDSQAKPHGRAATKGSAGR